MKKKLNGYLTAGLIITGLLLIMTLIGAFYTPYDPAAMSAKEKFNAPSLIHFFGTDNFGRDIFSRVLKGSGTTIFIALSTVAIGAAAGTAVGAVTGYFGGFIDEVLMRLNDALTAFPSILLALVMISILGPGSRFNVILALGKVELAFLGEPTQGTVHLVHFELRNLAQLLQRESLLRIVQGVPHEASPGTNVFYVDHKNNELNL
jgi:peptide/nickel transport system permease protein